MLIRSALTSFVFFLAPCAFGAPGDPGPKPVPTGNDPAGAGASMATGASSARRSESGRVPSKAESLRTLCEQVAKWNQRAPQGLDLKDSLCEATSEALTHETEPSLGRVLALASLTREAFCMANRRLREDFTAKNGSLRATTDDALTTTLKAEASQGQQVDAKDTRARLDELAAEITDSWTRVDEACGGNERSGVPVGLESNLANVVQGLGDFLVARADSELTLYGVETLGASLCRNRDVRMILFKETCETLDARPAEAAECAADDEGECKEDIEVDVDAVTSGRVVAALRRDLARLPVAAVDLLRLPPDDAAYVKALSHAIAQVPKGLRLSEIAREAVKYLKAYPILDQQGRPEVCVLDPGLQSMTRRCGAALLFETADVAARLGQSFTVEDWLDQTAVAFCGDFADESPATGKCLLAHRKFDDLRGLGERWLVAYETLLEVQDLIDELRRKGLTPETQASLLLSAANALEATAEATQLTVECFKTFPTCPEDPDLPDELRRTLAVMRTSAELTSAIMRKDVPDTLRAGRGLILAVNANVSPKVLRAVDFGLALSLAKTPEEAKAVIDSAAEPVGSYRAKYAVESSVLVSVNGMVGFFGGYERRGNTVGTTSKNASAWRLSAPVGIEFTPNVLSGDCANLGLGIVLLDPLALATVDGEGETPDPELETVLVFGSYLRLGLGKFPVNLVGMVTYQPWLRSNELCNGEPCWSGAWQVGGAVAVDVPIFILR